MIVEPRVVVSVKLSVVSVVTRGDTTPKTVVEPVVVVMVLPSVVTTEVSGEVVIAVDEPTTVLPEPEGVTVTLTVVLPLPLAAVPLAPLASAPTRRVS